MGIIAVSDRGKVRSHNEDYYFIPDGKKLNDNVMIIADGMGGHNAGDVASYIAVNAAVDYVTHYKDEYGERYLNLLSDAMMFANKRLLELSSQYEQYEGMGTTMTAAWVVDNLIYIAHIGDSRAYMITANGIQQLTEDHSLVQEMVNQGKITKAEAAAHPQRNIITRALGIEENIQIDNMHVIYNPGDIFMLCTDGLTCHLSDDEIWHICYSADKDLNDKAYDMMKLANERDGLDNITVILFQQC